MNQKDVEHQIKNGSFPDELSFDQFDDMGWESKQFGLGSDEVLTNNQVARKTLNYANKTGGQIYTQVDWDAAPDYCGYSKGMRFCNRTGLYEVVTGQSLKVDNT